jgi:segregation and condensation protein B
MPSETEIVEAVLFIGAETTTAKSLDIEDGALASIVDSLKAKYERQARPYRIERFEDGWRMRLQPEFTDWVRERTRADRNVKLGRPALEVLAAVAYRQPIGRPGIEALTNADAGPQLRKLIRMKLVEQSNEEDGPAVFRTTAKFLEVFKLKSPADLPTVER